MKGEAWMLGVKVLRRDGSMGTGKERVRVGQWINQESL